MGSCWIEPAHIFALPNKTTGFSISDMAILSTKTGWSCWHVSVDSVWLLPSCLQFQLMKRKRVRWNKEKTPLGNEVDWLAQVFTMLSKRVVGAFQKNRRCSAKESSVLGKRIDDATRKQSIYSQISLNCYASGSSNMGQNRLSRKSVEIQLEVEGKTNFVLWQKNISKQ